MYKLNVKDVDMEVETIVKGSGRRRLTILYSTSKRVKIHSGAPQAV